MTPTEALRERFEARFPVPGAVYWDGTDYKVRDGWENSYPGDRFCGQWAAAQWAVSLQPVQAEVPLSDAQIMEIFRRQYNGHRFVGDPVPFARAVLAASPSPSQVEAQPAVQPVAWRRMEGPAGERCWIYYATKAWDDLEPLYNSPPTPAAQTLSQEDRELMESAAKALEYTSRRLQMDIDDGGRPDHWSMLDLVRKSNPAIASLRARLSESHLRTAGAAPPNEKLRPLYYVAHPDGTFTVAEPQPVVEV